MQEKKQKPRTILVVDDEPDMLRFLDRLLTLEGYHVILASDGTYAMSLIREQKPDLVLLDIIMPGPDGFMVLDMIRKDSDTPVIMVTAKRDLESLQKTLDSGADDYIRKPFSPVELVARVNAKLRRA